LSLLPINRRGVRIAVMPFEGGTTVVDFFKQSQSVGSDPEQEAAESVSDMESTVSSERRSLDDGPRSEFEGRLQQLQRQIMETLPVSISSPSEMVPRMEGRRRLLVPKAGGKPTVVVLARIAGIADTPRADASDDRPARTPAASVLAGVHEAGARVLDFLCGDQGDVRRFAGVKVEGSDRKEALAKADAAFQSLVTCLKACYPEIRIEPLRSDESYEELLRPLTACRAAGSLLGNPATSEGGREDESAADRLIRSLGAARYCFCVESEPIRRQIVLGAFHWLGREIAATHERVRKTTNKALKSGLHASHEELDRFAQHYEDMLEVACEKIDAGLREGMWKVSATLLTESPEECERAGALLRSVFGSPDSKPEPVRFRIYPNSDKSTHPCATTIARFQSPKAPVPGQGQATSLDPLGLGADPLTTPLCSTDLARLVDLPRKEAPGYRVTQPRDFALDVPPCGPRTLEVGTVLSPAGPTKGRFAIELDDLTRHALIVGVTGSGKTNTAMVLLRQLWNDDIKRKIPFLVIEPAKAHYRSLLDRFPGMQIFAPGLGHVAPFRINPFEFPVGYDPQAHIAHLYTVFNAAFILYAPMPYVLERALYEVYEDRGWDLSAGNHPETRTQGRKLKHSWHWLTFPTLTDLYYKIGEVVDRLGYDKRIRMDVTAGLQARVDSLRAGQKGQTFDCRRSVPFADVLAKPTVMELSHLGSDEERAFLMGLLLMRLYETLAIERESKTLKHVTLIEEAHRLLTKTSTDVSAESANTKGQSVEAFCNILAEIRAYGEGLVVAEQIPSKLASDVLKNTNLKILHRIVAADDRELMGATMNLSESQTMAVTALERGQAAAFAEGWETAAQVKVPPFPSGKEVSEKRVGQNSDEFYDAHPGVLGQLPGCIHCRSVCQYGAWARRSATGPAAAAAVWSYATACFNGPREAGADWDVLIDRLSSAASGGLAPSSRREDQGWCLFAVASESAFWFLRSRGILLEDLDVLLGYFSHVADADRKGKLNSQQAKRSVLTPYRSRMRVLLERPGGPLGACTQCDVPCTLEPLGRIVAGRRDTIDKLQSAYKAEDYRKEVATACRDIARRALPAQNKTTTEDLAVCIYAHVAERVGARDPAESLANIFRKSS